MQGIYFIALAVKFKMGGNKNNLGAKAVLPQFLCKLYSAHPFHFHIQKQYIIAVISVIFKQKSFRRGKHGNAANIGAFLRPCLHRRPHSLRLLLLIITAMLSFICHHLSRNFLSALCCRNAALCSFTQLRRKHPAYAVHCLYYLIRRNRKLHAS